MTELLRSKGEGSWGVICYTISFKIYLIRRFIIAQELSNQFTLWLKRLLCFTIYSYYKKELVTQKDIGTFRKTVFKKVRIGQVEIIRRN